MSLWHFRPGFGDGAYLDDYVGPVYTERDADRVAAACFANGGDVNCGAAMAANHILAVLAVAFRAANAAGIQRDAPALRLLDDQEKEKLIGGVIRKKMRDS